MRGRRYRHGLDLIGTDYLDMVYIANPPGAAFKAVMDAIVREIAHGRLRAFGVRNWQPEDIRTAHDYAIKRGAPGIAAIVTTELAMPTANCPLWPQDLPFALLEPTVRDLSLGVLAHADTFNVGEYLFDESQRPVQPRW